VRQFKMINLKSTKDKNVRIFCVEELTIYIMCGKIKHNNYLKRYTNVEHRGNTRGYVHDSKENTKFKARYSSEKILE
jgi:hypothetical protein